MKKKLTVRILEAIIVMANQVEAGGIDEVQGMETVEEQNQVFQDMMDAATWAQQQLAKRGK